MDFSTPLSRPRRAQTTRLGFFFGGGVTWKLTDAPAGQPPNGVWCGQPGGILGDNVLAADSLASVSAG